MKLLSKRALTRFWATLLAIAVIALATESIVTAVPGGNHSGFITFTSSPVGLSIEASDDTLVLSIGH